MQIALNSDIKSGSAHKIPNPEFHYSDRSLTAIKCVRVLRQGLKTMKLQSKFLRFDPNCAQICCTVI